MAREALLGVLTGATHSSDAKGLAGAIVRLEPTTEEKRLAREALAGLLARVTDSFSANNLAAGLVQLDPTVRDLSIWHAATVPPVDLLAAVRQNSALADWLAALPSLARFSA